MGQWDSGTNVVGQWDRRHIIVGQWDITFLLLLEFGHCVIVTSFIKHNDIQDRSYIEIHKTAGCTMCYKQPANCPICVSQG